MWGKGGRGKWRSVDRGGYKGGGEERRGGEGRGIWGGGEGGGVLQ